MQQPRGKTLLENITSLSGHKREITGIEGAVKVSKHFVPGQLSEMAYGKEFATLKTEAKSLTGVTAATIDAKLTEIETKAQACFTNPDEANAKALEAAYKDLKNELKTVAEAKTTSADDKQKLSEYAQKLDDNKNKFNQEMSRLDERASTHLKALMGLQEADRDGYLPGSVNRIAGKRLMTPRSYTPTQEELDRQAADPSMLVYDQNMRLEEMKRLQAGGFEYYICHTEGFEGNLYEYSKDGCRPKPPVSDEKYVAAYVEAIELLRQKNPNCEVVITLPGLKSGNKEDLAFVNEKYIRDKLVPLLKEAHKRGIPVTLDPKLKEYLDGLKVEYEHIKTGADVGAIRKFKAINESTYNQINELFSLETSPENAKRWKERTQAINERAPVMENEIKQQVANLEVKTENKAVAVEYKNILQAAAAGPVTDPTLKEMRKNVLGIDLDAKRDEIKTTPTDAVRINGEIDREIKAKIGEIKAEINTVGEAHKKVNEQLKELYEKVAVEGVDVQLRNPFLVTHINRLEELALLQQEKLVDLNARAHIILQAAESRQSEEPANGDLIQSVTEIKENIQSISTATAAREKQSEEISAYKEARKNESDEMGVESKSTRLGRS